ncbi:hypothetical protein BC830DRAFT_1157970 [Chytriomyces sp. MP71]|nr:hypothetical protein BC830DRAFT_1157970 [Chytriomyces sp. MP71]
MPKTAPETKLPSLQPVALAKHPTEPKLVLNPCDRSLSSQTIIRATIADIRQVLATLSIHSDRIIYALAGLIFTPKSPTPYGGPKLKPGYVLYKGNTPSSLLSWIVTQAYNQYWTTLDPAILPFLVQSFQRVVELVTRGERDSINEVMMKGLKKAGHIAWNGAAYLPPHLREGHRRARFGAVEFSPPVAFPERSAVSSGMEVKRDERVLRYSLRKTRSAEEDKLPSAKSGCLSYMTESEGSESPKCLEARVIRIAGLVF